MKRDYSRIKKEFTNRASQIFTKNTFSGYSPYLKTDYTYIAPATKEYVFQWFWDTAFHVFTLLHFDVEWGKRELLNHLKAQDVDGFIPHAIFWRNRILPHWAYIESKLAVRPKHTAITQPPFLTIAAEEIYKRDQDRDFLETVVIAFEKYHRWLLNQRDIDKDGLISIISPNESGMDELPVYQVAIGFLSQDTARLHYYYRKADILNHRYRYKSKVILEKDYFNVEDILFNTINIEAMRSLARLLREARELKKATEYEQLATNAEQNLLKNCWNEEDSIFYSLYKKQQYQAKVKTIASLAPLYLSGIDKKKVDLLVKGHVLNPEEFYLPYPFPSVSKDEVYFVGGETPRYKIKLLWRGPTWINTNWIVIKGLRKHGYEDLAYEVVAKMVEMIKREGFREYYNPTTGVGYRRHDFGMSTTIIDLI